MAVNGTGYLSGTLTRNNIPYCDLEHDIGLIPDNDDDDIAERNTLLLTEALEAQWTGGSFRFRNGIAGPIVYAIRCPAKEFFFSGTVKTPIRIGGALHGAGGRAYAMTSDSYDAGSNGGAMTRFTWIDGASDSTCIRLRGCGFELSNIGIQGRPYTSDGTGEGPTTGTKANVGIEVEGRGTVVATGGHVISNCVISDTTYGICCRAGYYNDAGVFVSDESHTDTSVVIGTMFHANASCFRSENQQSLDWHFYEMKVSCWGGSGQIDTIVFDIYRGGNLECYGLTLLQKYATLLQVDNYSPWGRRFHIHGVFRDRYNDEEQYLTLFKYGGSVLDATGADWVVRVTGNIPQLDSEYDVDRLIEFTSGTVNFPLGDLLFDVTGMPHDDFTSAGGGYWTPDVAWL